MVGVAGFEPTISRPPAERDTRLRYTPMNCYCTTPSCDLDNRAFHGLHLSWRQLTPVRESRSRRAVRYPVRTSSNLRNAESKWWDSNPRSSPCEGVVLAAELHSEDLKASLASVGVEGLEPSENVHPKHAPWPLGDTPILLVFCRLSLPAGRSTPMGCGNRSGSTPEVDVRPPTQKRRPSLLPVSMLDIMTDLASIRAVALVTPTGLEPVFLP